MSEEYTTQITGRERAPKSLMMGHGYRITDSLVRLSVGVEHRDDIVTHLANALKAV